MSSNRNWTLLLAAACLVVVIAALLLAVPQLVRAVNQDVCDSGCAHTEIQKAIDEAADGDTIRVAQGIYDENLTITKSLTLLGGFTNLPSDTRSSRTTTIRAVSGALLSGSPDGVADYIPIVIQYPPVQPMAQTMGTNSYVGPGLIVTIDGFEITGGLAANGGGIHVDVQDGSQVVIHDNYIHDNQAGNGGGIYALANNLSELTITGNSVMSNTATGNSGGVHVEVTMSSTLTLDDNDVEKNQATTSYGGVYAKVSGFCQFSVDGNTVFGNTADSSVGGMFFVAENHSNGVFDDNTIEDNEAPSYGGGSLYFGKYSNSTFAGNKFLDNWATSTDIGGLYLEVYEFSQLTGSGLEIEGNRAAENKGGGALWAHSHTDVTLPGTRIVDNQASRSYGGVEFYLSEGYNTLRVPQLTVEDNHALDGEIGGVFLGNGWPDSSADTGHDTIIATGTVVISNTSVTNSASESCAAGGAHAFIRNDSLLDLSGSRFEQNTVQGDGSSYDHGGGLCLTQVQNSATANLDNTKYVTNTAPDGGGGLYVYNVHNNSALSLDEATFQGNEAGYGGGLYIDEGCHMDSAISIDNGTFEDNQAHSGDGGAIQWWGVQDLCQISVDDNRFYNNTSAGYGGAFAVGDGDNGRFSGRGTTASFSYNDVISNSAEYGGGVYMHTVVGQGGIAHVDYNTITLNYADNWGGGFAQGEVYNSGQGYGEFVVNGGEATFSYNQVMSNTAQNSVGGGLSIRRGVENSGKLTIENNTFTNNVSGETGGAVFVGYDSCGEFLAHGGDARAFFINNQVISNTAKDGSGGGVYIYAVAQNGARAYVDGNTIKDNTASNEGGGIAIGEYGCGGGLANNGAWASFSDNEIEDNSSGEGGSDGYGGGVYIHYVANHASTAEVISNTIDHNTAVDGSGGGMYVDTYLANMGSLVTFDDNAITHNIVSSTNDYEGGGLLFASGDTFDYAVGNGSTLLMRRNKINDNVAPGSGGGMFWEGGIQYGALVEFSDNELLRNEATGRGGGCVFDQDWDLGSTIRFTGNKVNNNTSFDQYGGCYVSYIGDCDVQFSGNEFNDNIAADSYGGLSFGSVGYADLGFWDNEIVGNDAGISDTVTTGGDYGGLYMDLNDAARVVLRDNEIRDNVAFAGSSNDGDFGGLYLATSENVTLTLADNVVSDNEAEDDYGGVYVDLSGESHLEMVHNTIEGNIADDGYGGLAIEANSDSRYILRRNKIVENSADSAGGLYIEVGTPAQPAWGLTENNLVADNEGSGVLLYDASLHSTNDTIANNSDYGIRIEGSGTISATVWVTNGIVWGNSTQFVNTDSANYSFEANYSDVQGGWAGTDNLDVNPQFVSAANGDYHLQTGSPVAEQANTALAPDIDLDGIPRPVPAAGDADMGAYEWFRAGVTLEEDQATTEDPGSQVVYYLAVTNDGNLADVFDIDVVANSLGWSSGINPESVSLDPDSSLSVQVTVQVPAGANAGTMNQITVRAVSQADNTVLDIAQIDTTVALAPAVSLEPDRKSGVTPASVAVYEHTLTNEGNGADAFQVEALSDQGWSVLVSPTVTTLPKGGSTMVKVYVKMPPVLPYGIVDVTTVTATSGSDINVFDTVADTTTREVLPLFRTYLPTVYRTNP